MIRASTPLGIHQPSLSGSHSSEKRAGLELRTWEASAWNWQLRAMGQLQACRFKRPRDQPTQTSCGHPACHLPNSRLHLFLPNFFLWNSLIRTSVPKGASSQKLGNIYTSSSSHIQLTFDLSWCFLFIFQWFSTLVQQQHPLVGFEKNNFQGPTPESSDQNLWGWGWGSHSGLRTVGLVSLLSDRLAVSAPVSPPPA